MLRARHLTALLLTSLVAANVSAASLFDPLLRFRMLTTEHFVIYFHQGEDRTARRLAAIAEVTWTTLQRPFGVGLPRRTHVVLADQAELANGYATPLPYDTVVVTAAWPSGVDFIGNTDDWLRLVFTHEFTHIVHLDRSEGWARAVRALFGRMPIAFPNAYLPTWQIEGLATYAESVVTGTGRLHAGDFGSIITEDARSGVMQPLDRLNGGLTDWPGGLGAYAYGLGFHQYLADRFGVETLGTLSDATAGRVPYTTSRVFRRIYRESLGDLWKEYQSSLRAAAPRVDASVAGVVRLTHNGFVATGPRFDRYDRGTIVYSTRGPHEFPAMHRISADGGASNRLATRYFGDTAGFGRDAIVFDQQEIHRAVGVYSDLYVLSRRDNHVRRLTSESRLIEPDLSPDEAMIACVQEKRGQRDLVLVGNDAAHAITALVSEPDTQFNTPRWSPDGAVIAVERHRLGHLSEIVIVDVASRSIRVIASDGRTRFTTPAWRPDGRALVVAAAPQDEPFNLLEISADGSTGPRQLTSIPGGATWPDVSPDGRTIVFVGYTTAGFDVFTLPYPAEAEAVRAGTDTGTDTGTGTGTDTGTDAGTDTGTDAGTDAGTDPKTYSPLRTLKPTSWSPVIETANDQLRVGAALSGYDVLGYHVYSASATWLASGPDGVIRPSAATPDWRVFYGYERWQPTFWTAAEASTSFLAGPADASGQPTAATLREHEIEAGVLLQIPRTRYSRQALFSMIRAVDDYTLADRTLSRNRTAARAAASIGTAHTYGYSISPEGGVAVGATVESVRRALGSFADATIVTADARAYMPGFAPHHVVAIRLAGGRSTGDATIGRTFLLGGADPNSSVISFDRDAMSLMRGFPENRFAGSHVALFNAEYRFPIARLQRGSGTWPLFLHTLHAAAVADVGHAWNQTFRASAIKTSIGAELSANVIAGYFFPYTVTVGAAWGHDGSGTLADRAALYFRLRRSF